MNVSETWKVIPSLPEYIASSKGRVMRIPYEKPMPYGGIRCYGGQPTRGQCHEGNGDRPTLIFRKRNFRMSRLICEAFHGPSPFPNAVVMHIDDDQTNNAPENLKWGTQKENLNAPQFIRKLQARVRRFTGLQVHEIRSRRRSGEQLKSLAKEYCVSLDTISNISLHKTYVDRPESLPAGARKVAAE
ncbi:MAG: endonuclease [Hyphomicrobiales bacterium]|nr:endonuclease [Hyphomicrobiales bacterium]